MAAAMVLVSHSFALTGHPEPILGNSTLGTVAVDIFFVTSGFLITSSLLNRRSAVDFVWGRVLRIYPALLVNVILIVFVLGPAFTILPLNSYFHSRETYQYLVRCATLVRSVAFSLPGVFEHNTYPRAVNSSLWTLPIELRMYLNLLCLWLAVRVVGKISPRLEVRRLFTWIVLGWTLASCFLSFKQASFPLISSLIFYSPYLSFMFFMGASAYVLKEWVRLSSTAAWICVAALGCAVVQKQLFEWIFMAVLVYIVLTAAFLPAGILRKYNLLGDYSYGVYIYAFPVQQAIAAIHPGISTVVLLAIASPVTLALSVLSWHLLEKRFLAKKTYWAQYTRRLISGGIPANTEPVAEIHGAG